MPVGIFEDTESFEKAQRFLAPLMLPKSAVPVAFRGNENMGNALMALEVARRLKMPYLMVVQNLHPIHGRLSWASSYIIAAINSTGKFKGGLRFRRKDLGKKKVKYGYWQGGKYDQDRKRVEGMMEIDDFSITAYGIDKDTGEEVCGVACTIELAVKEGWYLKNDSKWQTMPELMSHYRAATFFGRLYCPEVLVGLHTADEAEDIQVLPPLAQPDARTETVEDLKRSLAPTIEIEPATPEPTPVPASAKAPRKQSPKPHVNIPTQPAPEPEPQFTEPDPFAEEPAIEAQAELMPAESAEDMEAKERIQLDEFFPLGATLRDYAVKEGWITDKQGTSAIDIGTVRLLLNDASWREQITEWHAAQRQSKPAPKTTPAPVSDAPRSERQVKMGELGEFLSDLDPDKAIMFASKQGMIQNGDWATISDANLNKVLANKPQFATRVRNQK